MKKIAILGSTGSIGTQTLEVARNNGDLEIVSLAAGSNIKKLEEQIREFHPKTAAVWSEEKAKELRAAVRDLDVRVVSGMDGLIEVCTAPEAEIVVTAIVGMIGIVPTIAAMKAGKDIALANKETLVTAGHIIIPLAKETGVKILPVDSEHSAIFQCLNGEDRGGLHKILLTASGGPFRGKTRGETIRDINAHMLKELQKIDIDNDFEAAFHCFMLRYAMRENSYFSIESGKQRAEKFPVPTVEEYIHQPDNGGYAAVALEFIQAQHTGCPVQMVLSVPNNGALDFLRAEDVCELSCTVDRDGVHPHKVNYVPEMQKNLICTVKQYENLTVEAIMTHNRQKAVQALTLHPLVCSYPLAEALVDAYAKQYQDYIGAWEK